MASQAFELDEVSFKMILMGKSQQDGDDYNKFLKEVTILKHLPPEDIQTLAGCLKEVVYPEGKNVICEVRAPVERRAREAAPRHEGHPVTCRRHALS